MIRSNGTSRRSLSTTAAAIIIVIIIIVAAVSAYYIFSTSSTTNTAKVNLTIGILPTADAVPFFAAIYKGYFAQQGLNITIKFMAGGAVIAPAVNQGTIQLGEGTPITLAASNEQGFTYRYVTPMSATVYPTNSQLTTFIPGNSTHILGVLASSNITSFKDLAGKTVAVNTLGTFTQAALIQALKLNGVDPTSVHIVAVPPTSMLAELEQKRIDAADFFEPFATELIGANQTAPTVGAFRIVGDIAHIGNVMQAGFFGTQTWINANPNTVKAFVTAYDKGVAAVRGNTTLARQMLHNYLNMNSTLADKVVLFNYPTSPMPYSLIQTELNLGLQTGLLKNQSDNASQLVDPNYFTLTQ